MGRWYVKWKGYKLPLSFQDELERISPKLDLLPDNKPLFSRLPLEYRRVEASEIFIG